MLKRRPSTSPSIITAAAYGSRLKAGTTELPIRIQTADTRPHSRGTISPELCVVVPPKKEGAGNAGCALHPRSRVQNGKRKRTRAYRFSGGNPTFPAQWFYGLLRDLPGDQDLFVTVAPRMMAEPPGWAGFASARLDANHEASGPHDFAVRSNPSSPSGFAGHARLGQEASPGKAPFVSAPLIAHGPLRSRPAITCRA